MYLFHRWKLRLTNAQHTHFNLTFNLIPGYFGHFLQQLCDLSFSFIYLFSTVLQGNSSGSVIRIHLSQSTDYHHAVI